MSTQLRFKLVPRFRHGGRRKGSGRPKSRRVSHLRRRSFSAHEPLHVTLRVREEIPSLRRPDLFAALGRAVAKGKRRGLAVIHFAILSNHLHLILEAQDRGALAKQMQSFALSFARRANHLIARKGAVFAGRYHVEILSTPTQTKNAILYVLANEWKHRGWKGKIARGLYSSAALIADADWKELLGPGWRVWLEPVRAKIRACAQPRTWLIRAGWKRGLLRNIPCNGSR